MISSMNRKIFHLPAQVFTASRVLTLMDRLDSCAREDIKKSCS